jgi:hypothetical protein
MGAMPDCAPTPTEDRKPAWRAACLAYRERRRAGSLDLEAYRAACAALREVSPELTIKEASAEATNAISFASTYHGQWFWAGVGSR